MIYVARLHKIYITMDIHILKISNIRNNAIKISIKGKTIQMKQQKQNNQYMICICRQIDICNVI
jgi:signal transduction histidine kinase